MVIPELIHATETSMGALLSVACRPLVGSFLTGAFIRPIRWWLSCSNETRARAIGFCRVFREACS